MPSLLLQQRCLLPAPLLFRCRAFHTLPAAFYRWILACRCRFSLFCRRFFPAPYFDYFFYFSLMPFRLVVLRCHADASLMPLFRFFFSPLMPSLRADMAWQVRACQRHERLRMPFTALLCRCAHALLRYATMISVEHQAVAGRRAPLLRHAFA